MNCFDYSKSDVLIKILNIYISIRYTYSKLHVDIHDECINVWMAYTAGTISRIRKLPITNNFRNGLTIFLSHARGDSTCPKCHY